MTPPANAEFGVPEPEEARGTGTPTPTVKTEPGVDGALINIKVTSQTAGDVFFRVKRNVKLRRIVDMYCGKHSLHPKAVKFVGPEGGFTRAEQTPDEVGLDDGDEISVVLDQEGGGGAPVRANRICNVKLRRIVDMYCGKHSLHPKAVKFVGPEGGFTRAEQTPDEVGLDDGDEISVVLDQEGGGGAPVRANRISA